MPCILIIDDDFQVRAMLRQMLEREGYEVMEACDGAEGVRLYREQQADIIILDCPNHMHIPYRFGGNLVETVVKEGKVVYIDNQ